MYKTVFYFVGITLFVIFILFILQNLIIKSSTRNISPTSTPVSSQVHKEDLIVTQGIIFKGIYTYGIGTKLDCNTYPAQDRVVCEQRNKDNYLNPAKAELIPTNVTIEDESGNKEIEIYYDGSKDFKINLTVGYHRICAKYEGKNNCLGVTVLNDKYVDFAIPIMRQ